MSAYIGDDDLKLNSTSYYVRSYKASDAGKTSNKFSGLNNASSYAMTMKFATSTTTEFNALWKIRAYVKLQDGRVYYTGVRSYSITNIAKQLYDNCLMQNAVSHNYLYDHILSKVEPNYPRKDYQ